MERYLTGLLTDLPHKTADTIAAAVVGTSTELLQHSLNDATWDALALDEARVKRLLVIHPPKSGVLVFDDTGLPKKGTESVGVAAQYSGMLGKIGNCQVVVSAEYLCRLAPGVGCWPIHDGWSSGSTKMPSRNAAWTTSRGDAGMGSIYTWLWSCWCIVSSNGCPK